MNAVLILGANGFIGKNFCNYFSKIGTPFWAPTRSELDVSNTYQLLNYMRYRSIRSVINLISYGVNPSQNDKKLAEFYNSQFPLELFQFCNELGIKNLVHYSSFFELGQHDVACDEFSKEKPFSIYSETKLEGVTRLRYLPKAETRLFILRLFHVWGAFEASYRLTSSLVSSFYSRNPLKMRDGKSIRDFVFVEDVCKITHQLLLSEISPEDPLIHVSSNCILSIKEFVDEFLKITKCPFEVLWNSLEPQPSEISICTANISKLLKIMPTLTFHNLENAWEKVLSRNFIK